MRMVPAGVCLEQVFRPPEPAWMYPIFPNVSPAAVCGTPHGPPATAQTPGTTKLTTATPAASGR
jgi:hypothetical protein